MKNVDLFAIATYLKDNASRTATAVTALSAEDRRMVAPETSNVGTVARQHSLNGDQAAGALDQAAHSPGSEGEGFASLAAPHPNLDAVGAIFEGFEFCCYEIWSTQYLDCTSFINYIVNSLTKTIRVPLITKAN